jgi:hypothetical protein
METVIDIFRIDFSQGKLNQNGPWSHATAEDSDRPSWLAPGLSKGIGGSYVIAMDPGGVA